MALVIKRRSILESRTVKRIGASILAGVVMQILLFVILFAGAKFIPEYHDGILGQAEEALVIAIILAMPGFGIMSPPSTLRDPHPGLSPVGSVLALGINIAIYAIVIYLLLTAWHYFKTLVERHARRSDA